MKPGYKTTEFYKTMFMMIIGTATGLGIIDPLKIKNLSGNIADYLQYGIQIIGFITAASSNVSYNNSRGTAKSRNEEK